MFARERHCWVVFTVRVGVTTPSSLCVTSTTSHVVEHNIHVNPHTHSITSSAHIQKISFRSRSCGEDVTHHLIPFPPGTIARNDIFTSRRCLFACNNQIKPKNFTNNHQCLLPVLHHNPWVQGNVHTQRRYQRTAIRTDGPCQIGHPSSWGSFGPNPKRPEWRGSGKVLRVPWWYHRIKLTSYLLYFRVVCTGLQVQSCGAFHTQDT